MKLSKRQETDSRKQGQPYNVGLFELSFRLAPFRKSFLTGLVRNRVILNSYKKHQIPDKRE